jgi:hypothetical protein
MFILLAINERQVKITVGYYCTPIRMVKIKKIVITTNAREKMLHLLHVAGESKIIQPLWNGGISFIAYTRKHVLTIQPSRVILGNLYPRNENKFAPKFIHEWS